MAITGKTGADAIFKALSRICIVIAKYRTKLDAVIDAAAAAGTITGSQATAAHDFVATAAVTCGIFNKIAGYSGF